MDFFAIVSMGAYPTAGTLATPRAAYAVSYGLLGSVPAGSLAVTGSTSRVSRRRKKGRR